MEITLLGTGAPLRPDCATTGLMVTAEGCAPLLIDTCGGLELARQLAACGFTLEDVRNVIVTHRHLDHSGGMQALFLARIPLEIYANDDALDGIRAMTAGSFPEWRQHPEIARRAVVAGTTLDIGGFCVS